MKMWRATVLDAPAERVWEEVNRTRLLPYVAFPLQSFAPVDPAAWPEFWVAGTYDVSLRTFGFVPMGRHRIAISFPGALGAGFDARHMLDDGGGYLIKRWRHLISVTPLTESRCAYRDDVEIRAGILTPFVYLFAMLFYWHRQRRWRRLVAAGFRYPAGW